MEYKKRKPWKTIIQILVSIIGLAFIFSKIPFTSIYTHWNINILPWIILVCFSVTLSMLIQANRWKGLSVQGEIIPLKTYYTYTAIGYFFNNFLPTGFGGDAVKSIAFGKKFNQTSQSISAVLISRIQGLLALFLYFFIALPFAFNEVKIPLQYTLLMSLFLILCIILIIICLFSDKIKVSNKITKKLTFIPKFQKSLSIYRNFKKQLLLSSIDSIILQFLALFNAYIFFKAIGIEIPIGILIVFTSITTIVTMIPISLNGIGIREGIQIFLYTGLYGISADKVLSAALLGYIPLAFQALQGAILFLLLKKESK